MYIKKQSFIWYIFFLSNRLNWQVLFHKGYLLSCKLWRKCWNVHDLNRWLFTYCFLSKKLLHLVSLRQKFVGARMCWWHCTFYKLLSRMSLYCRAYSRALLNFSRKLHIVSLVRAVQRTPSKLAASYLLHKSSGIFRLLRNHCSTHHSSVILMQMRRAQNKPTPGLQHWTPTEPLGRNTVFPSANPLAFPKEQKRNFFSQFDCESFSWL